MLYCIIVLCCIVLCCIDSVFISFRGQLGVLLVVFRVLIFDVNFLEMLGNFVIGVYVGTGRVNLVLFISTHH